MVCILSPVQVAGGQSTGMADGAALTLIKIYLEDRLTYINAGEGKEA